MSKVLMAMVFSLQVQAASRSGSALSSELKNQEFTASLKEGFHFNEKAPNSLSLDGHLLKAKSLSVRKVEFSGLPQEFQSGRAMLYVCDDALTFCETRALDLKTGGDAKLAAAQTKNVKTKVNALGFIEDNFAYAVAQAKSKKQLVLIDFGARWCPSCVRLEREVFATAEFRKASKAMIKLRLDADIFENSVLMDKFKIDSIPELLILTADQEEVSRLEDYQPLSDITAFLNDAVANPQSLTQLASARGDTKRLGLRLLAAKRAKEALPYLEKVQPPPLELWNARLAIAKPDKKAYAKALKAALKAEPSSSRSLGWRTQWIDLMDNKDEIKKLRTEGLALADTLLSDDAKLREAVKSEPPNEFSGYDKFLVAFYRGQLAEAGGLSPDEAAAGWKKSAEVIKGLNIPVARIGTGMRYLNVLGMAKNWQELEELSAAMLKLEPKNPEIERRRLKALIELGRFAEAIPLGEKVLKNSFGRNEFWVATLLAEAYVKSEHKLQAKALIFRYLGRHEINWPNMASSRKTLEKLQGEI